MATRLVFVQLAGDLAAIKYGFRTRIDSGKGTVLGHQLFPDSGSAAGLVLGVNAPKPQRAAKRFTAEGVVSSFIAPAAIVAAKSAGWKVGRPKGSRLPRATAFSTTYYVLINGIKLAWQMPRSVRDGMSAQFPELKIIKATSADSDLVYGASFPQPPKVKFTIFGGDEEKSFSTFADNTTLDNLSTGFSVINGGRITLNDINTQ